MNIDVDVHYDWDDRKALRTIDGWQDRAKNFKPVFKKIQKQLERSWADNFTVGGLLAGGWAPLSARYGAWKSVHFPGTAPMVRTGNLFKSLSDLRGAPNEINKTSARFGTNIEYAKFHQYGTSRMPKRQVVYEPTRARSEWAELAKDHILGKRQRSKRDDQ